MYIYILCTHSIIHSKYRHAEDSTSWERSIFWGFRDQPKTIGDRGLN